MSKMTVSDKTTIQSRWKIFEAYFTGPGNYSYGDLNFTVGPDRIFETDAPPKHALYMIAESEKDS